MQLFFAATVLLGSRVLASPVAQEKPGQSLLLFSDAGPPVWYTQEDRSALEAKRAKFIDVTTSWAGHVERVAKVAATQASSARLAAAFPQISQQDTVKALIANLSITNLENYLSTMTSFFNRFLHSESGEPAAESVYGTVSGIALDAGRNDVSVIQISHTAAYPSNLFYQKSVIAKIAGADPDAPIVIFGAHLDSTGGDWLKRGPGADDDGSGSVTLLEAYRALLQNGFTPSTPLEFHWYAGEEGGLLGSGDIATRYADAGVPVRAMVQFDMTAYTKPGEIQAVTFLADYVDLPLTDFLASLVDEYLSIGHATTQCGYGCSDHASWTRLGYPSASPFETQADLKNPTIHTPDDTVDVPGFSFEQILEFTKLTVAAAVELTA
ncbi:Zn-dependent exopeptidase [Auricularia subglabra TFB-10046 SS5]|nr:Zn-dependent exopeptidase [Auricularia subglabra TFB-10046 SS5]